MITKLYNYLKQNIKFFIIFALIFFICTFELPFYINAPGGLLDVKDRVFIEDSYDSKGGFYLAYVSEINATIPTLLYSYFNKDWNVLKKEEVIQDNETIKENNYRNQLLLEESKNNALIMGFKLANIDFNIDSRKLYVTYVDKNASTDLKIGDEIISINNIKINSKNDAFEIIKENDFMNIEVLNDGKKYIRSASKTNGVIGILVSEIKEISTDKKIEFRFKDSESGPSGGFMMALSIYNYLTEEDITNGMKIVGTGTIDENGEIGPIGGVSYKIKAAERKKADIFFVPVDNYDEALKVKNENNLKINLVSVSNINEAIRYLKNL